MADLKAAALVPVITAVATVSGALGGTYLGSRSAQNVTHEQLRHEDVRHLYDLRREAYVQMAQLSDKYSLDLDSEASPKLLDQDGLAVRRAADMIDVIGTRSTARAADALFETLDRSALPNADLKAVADAADPLYANFVAHARADIGSATAG